MKQTLIEQIDNLILRELNYSKKQLNEIISKEDILSINNNIKLLKDLNSYEEKDEFNIYFSISTPKDFNLEKELTTKYKLKFKKAITDKIAFKDDYYILLNKPSIFPNNKVYYVRISNVSFKTLVLKYQ
jgi:23S rRNA-/tRNA-specific pseudouridylate synthase